MKLTCDLCGGTLQMNSGGMDASCTGCGLNYPLERLREKLGMGTAAKQETPPVVNVQNTSPQHQFDEPVAPKTVCMGPGFVPAQFVMYHNGTGNGDLCGFVQSGGIGVGDNVYINGDYSHPYQIYLINDNSETSCVKEGMAADLFLVNCPSKILRNARIVTGDKDPVVNAYNYPGRAREYFTYLTKREFSEYDVYTRVSHSDLTIPVDFVFQRGGKPVLALFVINSNDSAARYQVKKAARIFGEQGVATTHFFENYRNDMPYAVNRVRSALCGR